MLVPWSPSGAVLKSHHECALSPDGTHLDVSLDVARIMCLSGILGHGAGALVSQWGSTKMSP